MKINTELLADQLSEILSKKIAENIEINTSFKDGKLMANLNLNEDYLRGILDAIAALSEIEIQVFD